MNILWSWREAHWNITFILYFKFLLIWINLKLQISSHSANKNQVIVIKSIQFNFRVHFYWKHTLFHLGCRQEWSWYSYSTFMYPNLFLFYLVEEQLLHIFPADPIPASHTTFWQTNAESLNHLCHRACHYHTTLRESFSLHLQSQWLAPFRMAPIRMGRLMILLKIIITCSAPLLSNNFFEIAHCHHALT